MTSKEFVGHIEEVLEVDPGSIRQDQLLSSLGNWDSLAIMTFIAMVDEQFSITLPGAKIAGAKTVNDLILLLEGQVSD